eukprot:1685884-Pleurochrysis_carterae.AAC.3
MKLVRVTRRVIWTLEKRARSNLLQRVYPPSTLILRSVRVYQEAQVYHSILIKAALEHVLERIA